MLEIIDCEQGTDGWIKCRAGCVTASCFSDVIARGAGKTRKTYMLKLAGERITSNPMDSYTNPHMERGKEQEAIARQVYIDRTGAEVIQCGFMKDGCLGYSPDGLVGDDGLIEIKSKLAHLQAEIILSDSVPSEHMAQIQGGLLVSGRKWLDFISYTPNMPIFNKRVERDEVYIAKLKEELEKFELELNEIVTKIMEKF